MSRRLAGAVVALMFAGSAGTGLLAIRNQAQAPDTPKTSPETVAIASLNSGLQRLARKEYEAARKDFDAAKQTYMHLFVNDRTASHGLMKTMKAWVAKHRAQPAGVDAAAIDAFGAWVLERDTLAMSVGNLGHNSPDWK